MSVQVVCGLLLIALPILFNASFATLAALFDYPDVLRRPTVPILQAFAAGGERLLLAWWAFALSAVLFIPTVVLVSRSLGGADPAVLALATAIGVSAGLAQAIGLLRWPFAVPYLARRAARPVADAAFQVMHRALGVGIGEHLGYLLTGGWTLLAGIAMTQTSRCPQCSAGSESRSVRCSRSAPSSSSVASSRTAGPTSSRPARSGRRTRGSRSRTAG